MPASAAPGRTWSSPAIPTWCRRASEAKWTHPAVRRRNRGGMLYGRGAVDMKGGIACALAAALDHLAAHGGKPQGLDLVSDHRRRGKHRRQRHHQAAEMGARARREIRPLHPAASRAMRRRSATPSRSAGAARSTARWSSPASRAMSPTRSAPTIRCAALVTLMSALMPSRSTTATRSSTPRTSNSPRSISATPSSISFRARRARASTSASTIITATLRSRC